MPRLFTAIEIPEKVRDELHRLQHPLPGARWMTPDGYHLSLRFAGDIDNGLAREFAANLATVDMDAFELTLEGLGTFGGNDPRSLWAGVAPSAALEALARAHEKAARASGLRPEKRAFKPHVTLARLRGTRVDAVAQFLTQYSGYRSKPFFAVETVLMSSRPLVGGGPYGIEDTFALRGGLYASEDYETNW